MSLLRGGGFLSAVALVLMGGVLTVSPASAASVTVTLHDIVYTADDADVSAGAEVTGYSGPGGAIPDTVTIGANTYDVVSIPANQFQIKDITSVTLGANLTTIGNGAFLGNPMTSLTLGSSVKTIGEGAFDGSSRTDVTIPNSVTTIGKGAFQNNALVTLNLGNSLSTIGEGAFSGHSLTNLTIPNSVTTIDDSAFAGNAGLHMQDLNLGSSVQTIGEYAFSNGSLTNLTIPDSVTSIDDYAFRKNEIASLNLGNGLTSIGQGAFGDNSLETVTFPASVSTIARGAFTDNPLKSVRFTGPAPTGVIPGGPSETSRAFPTTTVMEYLWAHDVANGGGFTSPMWNGNPSKALREFIVTFGDLNGPGSVTSPDAQTVLDGDLATEPPAPESADAGWFFRGWYTMDADGNGSRFDFDTPITGDTVLYAGWQQIADTDIPGDADDADSDEPGDSEPDDTDQETTATAGALPNTGGPAGSIPLLALSLMALGLVLLRRRA